eukprot:185355-Hanusia_phi.AAC.10
MLSTLQSGKDEEVLLTCKTIIRSSRPVISPSPSTSELTAFSLLGSFLTGSRFAVPTFTTTTSSFTCATCFTRSSSSCAKVRAAGRLLNPCSPLLWALGTSSSNWAQSCFVLYRPAFCAALRICRASI